MTLPKTPDYGEGQKYWCLSKLPRQVPNSIQLWTIKERLDRDYQQKSWLLVYQRCPQVCPCPRSNLRRLASGRSVIFSNALPRWTSKVILSSSGTEKSTVWYGCMYRSCSWSIMLRCFWLTVLLSYRATRIRWYYSEGPRGPYILGNSALHVIIIEDAWLQFISGPYDAEWSQSLEP
jgi:hypothetical protein